VIPRWGVVALLAWAFAAPPATAQPAPEGASPGIVDRVAAVVNNDVVALSEVYDLGSDFIGQRCPELDNACVAAAELEVLDALIRRALVQQELERLQIDPTAQDVDQAIDRTVQSYQLADRQALRAEIEASGKRWDQYRDELAEYLRTETFKMKVLFPRITVTDDETRDLYQRTARSVSRPVVKLSGLGIPITPDMTPQERADVLAQTQLLVEMLNTGRMKWEEAVQRYDGGVAGMFVDQEFDEESMKEELAAVVFAAPVGVVQPPVRVNNPDAVDVLFVLRVDERTQKSRAAAYEDVKPELENQVLQQKLVDAEEEWYQRARREAAISVKIGTTS
jgi:parvulin-like peptidyl-prolyl isomerase